MTQPTFRLDLRIGESPSMPLSRLAPTFPTHHEQDAIEGYLRHLRICSNRYFHNTIRQDSSINLSQAIKAHIALCISVRVISYQKSNFSIFLLIYRKVLAF